MPAPLIFSALELPYEVYDTIALWAAIPAGLFGIGTGRIDSSNGHGRHDGGDHGGGQREEGERGGGISNHGGHPTATPVSVVEHAPTPVSSPGLLEWLKTAGTITGGPDLNGLTEDAVGFAIWQAHDRSRPLELLGGPDGLIEDVCTLALTVLHWRENTRQGRALDNVDGAPLHDDLWGLCSTARDLLDEAADDLWADVRHSAVLMAEDARGYVAAILRDLKNINAQGVPELEMHLDVEVEALFVDLSFFGNGGDSPTHLRAEEGGRKTRLDVSRYFPETGGPPRPPAPLTSEILKAFSENLAAGTSGSGTGSSEFGIHEAQFIEQVCQGATSAPTTGPGGYPHPGCIPLRAATDPVRAWEDWAAVWWSSTAGRDPFEPPSQEPSLVALARHLTTAGHLLDQIIDTIARIPESWLIHGLRLDDDIGRKMDAKNRRAENDSNGKGESEGEDKDSRDGRGESWPWLWSWAQPRPPSQSPPEQQPKGKASGPPADQAQGGSSREALRYLTRVVSHIRTSQIAEQEAVVVAALYATMEVNSRWKQIIQTLDGLLAGRIEEWEGEQKEGEEGPASHSMPRRRKRLPPPAVLVGIFESLDTKLESWEALLSDWHLLVLYSTISTRRAKTEARYQGSEQGI